MPYVMSTHLLTYTFCIRPPCLYINAYIDTYIMYNIRYYIRIIKYFETAHICKRKQLSLSVMLDTETMPMSCSAI